MVSVITWQTIYLNGIIHSFDLAKANMHVAEEKSVTHKTQNTRRAFLCVTDKRDNCSTIIRKSKFPPNPERSVQFSGKRTKRSVQKIGCTQHL